MTQAAPKTAIITGASSGIGWHLALELASRGWALGLMARRAEQLQELASKIKASGGKAHWVACDVTDTPALVAAVGELADKLGGLGMVVANAGVGFPAPPDQPADHDEIAQVFAVNTIGVAQTIYAALPHLLKHQGARVVAVSSQAGWRGLPGAAPYCSSKAAVNVLMESLRIDLRRNGVSVTTVMPGFIRTPMTDVNSFKMPWLMEPEACAKAIASGIEHRRRRVAMPWQMRLLMHGVVRWLPCWLYERVMQKHVGSYRKEEPAKPMDRIGPKDQS